MRNVIVTGGSTGIGYAVAEAFAATGDSVVITGRRKDRLQDAVARLGSAPTGSAPTGWTVRGVAFDASDPVAVSSAVAELPQTVDVLVNNAGGNTDFDATADDDGLVALAESYRANLAANLLSAVLVTAAVRDRLVDGGRIVTIGSIAASKGAGGYGAAKAAVEAWSVSVATELGPRGITSNVVAPGLTVDTDFFRGGLTDERSRALIAATLNKRAGTPADVAATVRFLASPAAGHLTGQVLHVNGGAHRAR